MIFLADQFDDFLSLGDSLSNGFTDNFVNHFNFDLQFLGSFFQGGTDFLGEDIFASDGIFDHECCRWEKVLLDFLDDFLGLGDSFGDDFFHHFHDGFVFDLHGCSNFLDLGAPAFGEDIFAFEVGGEFDNFFTDQLDDFVSLGDSLFDGFTDDFVNNFSFYFQFLGSFVQGFADFLSKDFFTGDGILVNVEFSRWEKVLLDFLNDFLGLGDSLGNDLFHHFHDGFEFDLHGSSNFLDLVAPVSPEYIFAFQVGGHVDDFLADQFDDFLSFGDSLSNGFTDNFVNHFNFDLQFLGSFFQGGTDFLREDIFTSDGIFNHEFSRWEKVFLDFLDDFLGLGDSLGNDFFHHFHDSFEFDLHCSSNFLDLVAPFSLEYIFAFQVGGHINNLLADQFDDFLSFGDSLSNSFTDNFVNHFNFDLQFLGSFFQGGT